MAVAHGSADPGAAATATGLFRKARNRARQASAAPAVSAPRKSRRWAVRPVPRRSWRAVSRRLARARDGTWLEPAGPVPGKVPGGRVAGPLLAVGVAALAAAQYATGRPVAEGWLAIAPLLGSVVLRPLRTALLAGWAVLLGLGLALDGHGPAGRLASQLGVLVLLAAFAAANSVLRTAAQRRLGQDLWLRRVLSFSLFPRRSSFPCSGARECLRDPCR
jgi:hypothetical protein